MGINHGNNVRIDRYLKYKENELQFLAIRRLWYPFIAIILYYICVVLSKNLFVLSVSCALWMILISSDKSEIYMNEFIKLNAKNKKRVLFLSENHKECERYMNSVLAIPRDLRNADLLIMEEMYKEEKGCGNA